MELITPLSPQFSEFVRPSRYKVAYGGRGAGVSTNLAILLLVKAGTAPLRIVVVRKTQVSIFETVHRLISDRIEAMGLNAAFDVMKHQISAKNGATIRFVGMKSESLERQLEGADIIWAEEADGFTEADWLLLKTALRKDTSELWVSFRPNFNSDTTYQEFVVNPPKGAIVVKANYRDNPFLPAVLLDEIERCKEKDPETYRHEYEGEPL